jgi:hypothetical protein
MSEIELGSLGCLNTPFYLVERAPYSINQPWLTTSD